MQNKNFPDTQEPHPAQQTNTARQWSLWAHDFGNGRFLHIGQKRWVELHGVDKPVVAVNVIEDPSGDYWGWLDSKEDRPSMIWPSEILFRMCFTYGPDVEVERGKGTVLRLRVVASQ